MRILDKMAPTSHAKSMLLPTEAGGVELVAKFFRALSDPTRLRLLEFLLHEERTGIECVQHTGLSQGRISSHLGCLADCGYVQVRRDGRYTYYRASDPRVAEIVLLARSLAIANADALAACVRISAPS
jgi:ArsR family transcriptional regulator, cadmium/lead-responsive transcriptional repressor